MTRIILAALLALLIPMDAHAAGYRSPGDVPIRHVWGNDSSVNDSVAGAESVDLNRDTTDDLDGDGNAGLLNWDPTTGIFGCEFAYDEDWLMLSRKPGDAISASPSALTTPATDGTPTNIVRMRASESPKWISMQAIGWYWQSVAAGSEADVKYHCLY